MDLNGLLTCTENPITDLHREERQKVVRQTQNITNLLLVLLKTGQGKTALRFCSLQDLCELCSASRLTSILKSLINERTRLLK